MSTENPEIDSVKSKKVDKAIEGAKQRAGRLIGSIGSPDPKTSDGSSAWLGKEHGFPCDTEENSSYERDIAVRKREQTADMANALLKKGLGRFTNKGIEVDEISVAQYEAEKVNEMYDSVVSAKEIADRKSRREASQKIWDESVALQEQKETERKEALEREGKYEVVFSYDLTDITTNKVVDHKSEKIVGTPQELIDSVQAAALQAEWGFGNESLIQTGTKISLNGEEFSYDEFLREMRTRVGAEKPAE